VNWLLNRYTAMLASVGAITGYWCDFGSGWNAFYSVCAGSMLGQLTGYAVVNGIMRRAGSDAGFMLGAIAGGLFFAAIWFATGDLGREIIGGISRAVLGASAGWLLVFALTHGKENG
jgi:hypothetical protein